MNQQKCLDYSLICGGCGKFVCIGPDSFLAHLILRIQMCYCYQKLLSNLLTCVCCLNLHAASICVWPEFAHSLNLHVTSICAQPHWCLIFMLNSICFICTHCMQIEAMRT